MRFKVEMDIYRANPMDNPVIDKWDFNYFRPLILKDDNQDTDWWIEPLHGTLMLRPLQLSEKWKDQTGIVIDSEGVERDYRRLRKSFWVDAGNPGGELQWDEVEVSAPGDYWLVSSGEEAAARGIKSSISYLKNQPFFITWRAFTFTNDDVKLIEIYFGQYRLTVWGNGFSTLHDVTESDEKKKLKGGGYISDQWVGNNEIGLLILPYRGNSILFYSTRGTGWVCDLDRLTEKEAEAEEKKMQDIVKEGPLMIKMPVRQGYVQASHALFPSEALLSLPPREITRKIRDGDVVEFTPLWHVPDGTGVVAMAKDQNGDTVGPGDTQYSARFVLTTTRDYGGCHGYSRSPFVSGGRLEVVYSADDIETGFRDVTADVVQLSWTHDLQDGYSGDIALKNADNYIPGVGGVQVQALVRVYVNDKEVFYGVAHNPRYEDAPNTDPQDSLRTLRFSLKSYFRWKLENTNILFGLILDGEPVSKVYEFLHLAARLGSNRRAVFGNVSTIGMRFPAPAQAGEYNIRANIGDSLKNILELFHQYTGLMIDEQEVNGVFRTVLYDPLTYSTPVATYYKVTTPPNSMHPCKGFEYSKYPPLCNELNILFCDGTTNMNTCVTVRDTASQDPNIPHDERLPNWLGEVRRTVIVDRRNTDLNEVINRAKMYAVRPGVLSEQEKCTFESLYDPNVKTLSVIKIESDVANDFSAGWWQVVGEEVEFIRVDTGENPEVNHTLVRHKLECLRDYRMRKSFKALGGN